ncbi:MAG: Stage II sporulation protein E (SpoIIE) [Bacteroidetes bacterium ADurb.Bin145]|jgi:serine phosphatase RsbU (regulator of sigma subunit)|nr:MAG: Stage II sporulation protein E (SpoIIE) [Bacteroidetes bacterium ADurb.Bin145]
MGFVCFTYYYFRLFILSGMHSAWKGTDAEFIFSANNYLLIGSVVAAAVMLFILTRLELSRIARMQKQLKEAKLAAESAEKRILRLELRDKDMTDSLIYAQRIQEALLPSEDYFRDYFRDSFIFFRPKDIVSGDFYWIGEKGDKIFVVAADCTGHGVPGALMSVIGLDIIDKTINEENIEKPSRILAIMNKGLEKTFSREKNIGTIIRDGMDIGLCVIDRKQKRFEYAGAFFPLYLVRDDMLIEVKGDKYIIGMNPEGIEYTNHEVDLKEDDIIYIFSDGYVDQFGGQENKKFMYRRFRYLLLKIHSLPFEDQKAILEENITTWMSGNSQVDDIMVIGFKPLEGKR